MAWNMPSKNNDYRNKIDMIRRPEVNRMSRTKTRTEWRKRGGNTTPTGKRRKNAFDGAYVAEVRRQVQSGFQVAGTFLRHLHRFVIDMDLTSLYPTIMLILNLSPKTMVAKMFFAKTYKVPMYPYIKFIVREGKRTTKPTPTTSSWSATRANTGGPSLRTSVEFLRRRRSWTS